MDGWNEEKLSGLIAILSSLYNIQYEVENCVRGYYSGAHTYKELGKKIKELGNSLIEEGSYIAEELEEEEEYDEED